MFSFFRPFRYCRFFASFDAVVFCRFFRRRRFLSFLSTSSFFVASDVDFFVASDVDFFVVFFLDFDIVITFVAFDVVFFSSIFRLFRRRGFFVVSGVVIQCQESDLTI